MAFLRQMELDMSFMAEEIGYMYWQVEFGMSYMAGQWHPEANRIGYQQCGWLMTFLRKLDACAGQ